MYAKPRLQWAVCRAENVLTADSRKLITRGALDASLITKHGDVPLWKTMRYPPTFSKCLSTAFFPFVSASIRGSSEYFAKCGWGIFSHLKPFVNDSEDVHSGS